MDLVAALAGGVAVFNHSQRPHGALLLVDFFLSDDGQKILIDTFQHGSH
ncbi:MAG: hypothetical protein WBL40_20485 [Terrimicrobiaceae bacterium]